MLLALGVYTAQYAVLAQGFLLRFTDGDQLIVAEMAAYYARGVFPEPYFWGQSYLFPIESHVAAPLVFAGVRADLATLAVAAALFYMPFLYAGARLAPVHPWLALMVLATPLAVSPHVLLVSLMPRGFMGAIGLATLATLVFAHASRRGVRMACACAVGLSAAAYAPAALLLPALLLRHAGARETAQYALATVAGWLSVAALGLFYELTPDALVHRQAPAYMSIEILGRSLATPAVTGPLLAALVTPALAAMAAAAFQRREASERWRYARAMALLACVVAAMLASSKIVDARESVFFSGSRFWIGMPFAFLPFILHARSSPRADPRGRRCPLRTAGVLLLACAAISLAHTHTWLGEHAERELRKPRPVQAGLRSDVVERCRALARSIDRRTYYLVLEGRNDLLAYGCFPLSGLYVQQTGYDRRTWFHAVVGHRRPHHVPLP